MKKIFSLIFIVVLSLTLVACNKDLENQKLNEDKLKEELDKIVIGEEVLETLLEINISGLFAGVETTSSFKALSYSNLESAMINIIFSYEQPNLLINANSNLYLVKDSDKYYFTLDGLLRSNGDTTSEITVVDNYYYEKTKVNTNLEQFFLQQEDLILEYVKNDNIYELLSEYEALTFSTNGNDSKFTFILNQELLIKHQTLINQFLDLDLNFLTSNNVSFELVATVDLENNKLKKANLNLNASYKEDDSDFTVTIKFTTKQANKDIIIPDFTNYIEFQLPGIPGSKAPR